MLRHHSGHENGAITHKSRLLQRPYVVDEPGAVALDHRDRYPIGEHRGLRRAADEPGLAIEEARNAASRERRARRALLEHYVSLGISAEDAETAIEFRDLLGEHYPSEQPHAPPPGGNDQTNN